jgi:adenylosuccinate lyase
MGREAAHELIREHAVAAARQRREHPERADDLLDRLGADDRFPLSRHELGTLVHGEAVPVGRAAEQVRAFADRVGELVAAHPEAAAYQGDEVL